MGNNAIKVENGQVQICVSKIKSEVPFDKFVSFTTELLDKHQQIFQDDPVSNPSILPVLNRIDKDIEDAVRNLNHEEKLCCRYWLATIFFSYFSRYDLFREGFGCRRAWAHLLKMRYHSMLELYILKKRNSNEFTARERTEFLRAFRDWRDFCTNDRHHFLFKSERGLESPEREVKAIIYSNADVKNSRKRFFKGANFFFWKRPVSFLFEDKNGKEQLELLIADWFLRDRFDWFGAFALVWHRARQEAAVVLAILFLVESTLLPLVINHSLWRMRALLIFIYICVVLIVCSSFKQRTFIDVLLPRLWAAIMVGYIPLFLTSELWKMAYDKDWHWGYWKTWLGVPYVFFLNGIAVLLSFLYLRWGEVGKRLVRTPNLGQRIPILRALWLAIFGWMVSITSGLVILDIAGLPMARVALVDAEKGPYFTTSALPYTYAGLFGDIHLPVLFLFAPFALLVGVVLQIFWEEKPITQTA